MPIPICISSTTDASHGGRSIYPVSVARGNVIAADHGVQIAAPEHLGIVPVPPPAPAAGTGCSCGSTVPAAAPRSRYYPRLVQSPLTFSVPYNPTASARAFLAPDPGKTSPTIRLTSDDSTNSTWAPMGDLLGSDDSSRVFVTEIDQNGSVFVRFGDGQYGMAPEAGLGFTATYRVGNGRVGNVGHDAISHVLMAGPDI